MKLFLSSKGPIVYNHSKYYQIKDKDWDNLVNIENLFFALGQYCINDNEVEEINPSDLKAPIVSQEIWASGVTYLRSKAARMEESKDAGGGDFYDRVYDADRPELFFKATASRTVGHLQNIRIRKDSDWNVPEPEFTLFINSSGKIVGYTIGNDVSSREIEGENPLYLPQAKSYDKSAAIGPCLFVFENPIELDTQISLRIMRLEKTIFEGNTTLNQMKRKFEELVEYLVRECTFPFGCYLMTGTGIVPPDDFTLKSGDIVYITIDPIGTLINAVE